MAPAQGHVFVVHGRIELLAHDAAIIPTDAGFDAVDRWAAVVGDDAEAVRPATWGQPGVRHARGTERLWFLDVGRRSGDGLPWLLDGVHGVLTEVATTLGGTDRRALPLVVLPVVGIGAGGFGDERGAVIRGLLDVAEEVVREHPVDIAFVTPDPAVHGAVQHLRRQRAQWPLVAGKLDLVRALADRARSGELALFLGAGVSIPAGLPSWRGLLQECVKRSPDVAASQLDGLDPLDQAELLRRAMGEDFEKTIAELCTTQQHAIAHALLASLGCHEVVTTNFDRCFELAAEAASSTPTLVMPWEVPHGRQPWLLKLHGDADRPGSIVLTRRHFVRYDASSRPAASVLQALLLTRHLLVVGASLTDDNLLRLTHEVASFRGQHGTPQVYGTVLDVEEPGNRQRLWAGELDWLSMPGPDLPARARSLEVFLDVLAAHTAADTSWVLDERFEALLADEDRGTAARARALAASLPDRAPWADLRRGLASHGARQ